MIKVIKYIALSFICTIFLQSCYDTDDEYMYDKGLYKIDWNAAADSATTTLIAHFWDTNKHYFVYDADQFENAPTNNYWPQAHAMDVVIDAYLRTGDKKYSDLFGLWFEGIKAQNYSNPGKNYRNDFYDDSEWIALTMLRLYETTKEQKYLDVAKDLMVWIETGWNDLGGGGIAWERTSHQSSKNACSNGPAAILAARLYQQTKDKTYLEWAEKIYEWEKNNLFNQASGAVYDGMNGETGEVNTLSLSYNQGTFLGAAHELYKISGDATYLNDARKAALYGITNSGNIDVSNNILRDEGTGDGALFKGIFMRYFTLFILDKDLDPTFANKFTTFLNSNANMLWRQGVNKTDVLFGSSWATPALGTTQLTAQISGCTMIEAKSYYDEQTNNK